MQSNDLVQNQHIVVKRTKRGVFMFNRNDTFIGRSLDLYGEWCDSEIALLAAGLRPGDLVLDVGANIGTHTVAFAQMVGPRGEVHAFEPQRRIFQLLCGNVALNALENVWCHQIAVGSAQGTVHVPPAPPSTTQFNFGVVPVSKTGVGEPVAMVSIDSIGLDRCRLIKIDVEGMERDVLEGGRETIRRLEPVIFVEANSLDHAGPTIETVFSLGYRAYWHVWPYYNENNFFGNRENVFKEFSPEANLLCVPNRPDMTVQGAVECTGPDDNWLKAVERTPGQ